MLMTVIAIVDVIHYPVCWFRLNTELGDKEASWLPSVRTVSLVTNLETKQKKVACSPHLKP